MANSITTFFFLLALSTAAEAPLGQNQALDAQRSTAQKRYERVEQELARRDLGVLSADQRGARQELLQALADYRMRGDFGLQTSSPGARVPLFVDRDGRRCALAQLLHSSGRDDLVAAVQRSNNLAWVAELSTNSELLGWLDEHGLTLEEAARIQGPSITAVDSVDSSPIPAPTGNPGGPKPSAARPDSSGSTPRSAAVPLSSSGSPAAPANTTGPLPRSSGLGEDFATALFPEDEGSWWLWWEFNKIEFLAPSRRLQSGDPSAEGSRTSYPAFVRSLLLPVVQRALRDEDPQVRGSAALALGRMGGAQAVRPLLELLEDPHLAVREQALLGLGASGAPEAQVALWSLACSAHLPGSARDLGRAVQPLALVALGVGRLAGFAETLDGELARLIREGAFAGREDLGVAAMMYTTLVPSAEFRELALDLARAGSEPIGVRCRAIEALRSAVDEQTLGALQHLLGNARVELRRSAALALGEYQHALVPPALECAYDLEQDLLTRCLLLTALGRQGGGAAREFLLEELSRGPKSLRPWAALGLGLWARSTPDTEVATALRLAAEVEANAEARAAYWLALGLAGDQSALDFLGGRLAADANPRNRMYAAQALALLGGQGARTRLLERVPQEPSALVRSALALALGVLGQPSDAQVVGEVLASTSEALLQGQVASAMAFFGNGEAVRQLGGWASSETLPNPTRAAALDGLGMLLCNSPALLLGKLSRSSNFTLFAPWTVSMFATTL